MAFSRIIKQKPRFLLLGFLTIFLGIVVMWFRGQNAHFTYIYPSQTYSAFMRSLGSPPLPKEFLLHRKLDKMFLSSAKKRIRHRKDITAQKIPKIIHQIWLFPFPPPEEVQYALQTVSARNPSYTYMFWDRKSVEKRLEQEFGNHIDHLFSDALSLSDYIASLVLYEFGGIVIDPWCECVSSIDPLVEDATGGFIVGVEPPQEKVEIGFRRIFCSPALMATYPGNRSMVIWKVEMKKRLGALSLPIYEGWKAHSPYERMVWTSLDSLTDTIVHIKDIQEAPLPVGPTWWCPIRPKELNRFHKRIAGEAGHRSVVQKLQETFHVGLPLFSAVTSETVLVHLLGGRLGMKDDRIEKLFHMRAYERNRVGVLDSVIQQKKDL